MQPLRPLCALVFATFAFSACGGTSADSACTDIAATRCAQRSMCTNSIGITKTYGDQNTCLAREKLSCVNALAAKDTGNTPTRVETCNAALKTESCADFFAGNTPPACVNAGTLADSSACAFAGQCTSSYCTGLDNAACGTCGEPLATAADCSNGGTCARGQTCYTTTGANPTTTCLTEGGAGASCSRTAPCGTGFTCVGAVFAGMNPTPGSCMADGTTAGAACDPTARTGAGCERAIGLFCNTMSKTCTTVTYAADGAACGEGTDGNLTDCAGGNCYGSTNGAMPTMGTCKANAADGAACDTSAGPDCLAPARCVTASGSTAGTCMLANASQC